MTFFSFSEFFNINKPKNGRFYIIAIDGRGGSGKTSFTKYLKELLPDFVFVSRDDYFEPVENQIVWGAYNEKRFKEELIGYLKNGNKFIYKPYDWHSKPHISERSIEVTKGICIEGCISFSFDLDWDLKIWIETPKELCLERGIAREMMPTEKVIKVWQEIWQPEEDKYIDKNKPKEHADLVIDGTISYDKQVHA